MVLNLTTCLIAKSSLTRESQSASGVEIEPLRNLLAPSSTERKAGLSPSGVVGGHCYHWHPGGPATADVESRQAECPGGLLHWQRSKLFNHSTFPKRSHLLWLAWLRALQPLRPACSRTTTFLWLVLVLAALRLRPDLAGVTSLVRSLGLSDASYYCLLHFFHSSALGLDRLTQL